ncbi:hypothetical protein K3495_g1064 [Podosphaera aphanis]|nr:hypothetical protein K3495_g1064 [Podosphaera aphanis]
MNPKPAKSVGENTPALPVFSYAQAAKGRSALSTDAATNSNQPYQPNTTTITKDTNSPASSPVQGSELEGVSITGAEDENCKLSTSADETTSDFKPAITHQIDSIRASSGALPNLVNLDKDEVKEDDPALVSGASDRNLNGSQSSQRTDASQGKKGRKAKAIETEIEKQETKPEVFVPAPLPAVNYWQQRKEKLAMVNLSPATLQNLKTPINSLGLIETISTSHTKTAVELKKRAKHQSGLDNSERQLSGNQSGAPREATASSRTIRKSGDGPSKVKEDQSNKRSGPRANRPNEKDDKSITSKAPPPVEDATSWPTPETVLEEDKRKVQEKLERDEKEDNSSNKPRPKEKWVPVPYIPTVTFNTPIPTRGGRGRGGGRGSRGDPTTRLNNNQTSSAPMDKSFSGSLNNSKSIIEVEKQEPKDGVVSVALPSSKRLLGDATSARKSSNLQSSEKVRSGHSKAVFYSSNDYSNAFGSIRPDLNFEQIRDTQSGRGEYVMGFKEEYPNSGDSLKTASNDRRNDSSRNFDYYKDISSSKENTHQTRERGDGRQERSRGVYRGRGSHSNYSNGQPHPQSSYANGNSTQQQNGYSLRQNSDPYSPPLAPLLNTQFAPPLRSGRGGSRSQSITNSGIYGCFTQNGAPISQQYASIQTPSPMYDFAPIQPMSATTYQPFIDHVSLPAMVTMQLDYYFSIDNLCKDVFLRRHMDSQGYVFLSFIAGFKRIQALTQDFELIRFACQESETIELIRGDDGIDRLRRKEGWEKWVLNMDERDESTRNPGPSYWHRPQRTQKPQYFGQMTMTSPDSIISYSTESNFRSCEKIGPNMPSLNGTEIYQPETPLSAAVPDFAPSFPLTDSNISPLEAETTFHDDEVSNLTLVFAPPKENAPARPPFHNSSRTFSNGSIDRRSINEEFYNDPNPAAHRSRDASPENHKRPSNPLPPLSPSRSDVCNGPPVMWVKGQKQQVPVSERNSQELYIVFRARALKNRELSESSDVHPDMKLLYEFWSHFLCRNFNSRMYSEFRQFALEDAQAGSLNGMKNLISYYDEILNSKKKTIPEILARHFVDLVKLETSEERPAFKRLRAAWRNGALDLKSRKKLDSLVDSKLREELERASSQRVALP